MRQEKLETTCAEAAARLVHQEVSRREFLHGLSGGALALAAGGLLAGCGGGGNGSQGSATDQPLTLMPASQRQVAVDAINSAAAMLGGTDPIADGTAIANTLRSLSQIAAVTQAADGTVFGTFTDGQLYVFNPNDTIAHESSASSAARGAKPSTQARLITPHGTANETDLPQSTQARVLFGLGAGFGALDHTDTLKSLLTAGGYTVATGDATVSGLRSIQGDGVFYFFTHGVDFALHKKSGAVTFGISTSQVPAAADEDDRLFLDDLANKRIFYGHSKLGYGQFKYDLVHYNVTNRFVEKYWKFAPNALIYMSACELLNDGLRNSLGRLNMPCTLAGWDNEVGLTLANRVATAVFSGLLGTAGPPIQDAPNASQPPSAILAELGSQNLIHDSSLGGTFAFDLINGSKFAVLSPRLETIKAVGDAPLLTLTGIFGSRQGTVNFTPTGTENQSPQALAVQTGAWQSAQIVCNLPSTTGTITVSVDGRTSNPIELSGSGVVTVQ